MITTNFDTCIFIGSGGSLRHFPGEGYHSSPRQHYPPGTHVGQRPPFPDQRFGPGHLHCMIKSIFSVNTPT